MINTRAMVRAGGAMLLSLASAVGLQGVGAPATAAAPRIVHVSGTSSETLDFDTIELVPRGHQCLLLGQTQGTYSGTLEGTVATVEPEQVLFFVTCEELLNTPPGVVLPTTFRAVKHFVGTAGQFAGKEATMRDVGRTETSGIYSGITVVHGDMNGVLRVRGSLATGIVTYEGTLVVTD